MSQLIPRGVIVAPLGKRLAAVVIDALPLLAISALLFLVLKLSSGAGTMLVAAIVGAVLCASYALAQWWAYAARGAGLGAKAVGLRLVSMTNGEPIGWWRFFLRQAILAALWLTVVGGIALVVFLIIHERRQGWHDLAVGSVMVAKQDAAVGLATQTRKGAVTPTVGLPPHLASTFSPQPGTSSGFAPVGAAPDWLPSVNLDPVTEPQAPDPAQARQETMWSGQRESSAPTDSQSQSRWSDRPALAPEPGSLWGEPAPSVHRFPPTGGEPSDKPEQPADESVSPVPRPKPQTWIPLPTPSSVVEPSRSVRVRRREFGDVDAEDSTRIAFPPGAGGREGDEGWYLRLDDGREVELTVTVLLGRNPQRQLSDPQTHLVPASGDGRMISRTHVLIGTDLRGVYVVDRGSTNGTAVVAAGGELEPCPTGVQVRVREGQQVSYGNRWFTVLRRALG